MSEVVLAGDRVRLRPYAPDDVDALQRAADDPLVSRWMTARFPHPYTRADAAAWVAVASESGRGDTFVIEVDGRFAGGIGLQPRHGEHAGCAIFGYWLARAFWGRGLATDAARTLARHALAVRGLRRLEASAFAPNVASMRVLEKSGFRREAFQREAYVDRDGAVVDGVLYARLASDREGADG